MPPRLSRNNRIMVAAQVISQPVPVRPPMTGWNTRDDLDGMDPTDAVTMDNWYADMGGLVTRNGSMPWVTGLGGQCHMVAEYYSGATRKLIAGSGGRVFDATTAGSPTVLGTGFGADNWITTNFSGRFFLANGVDPVQVINVAAMASAAFTGPPTNPRGVFTFRGRLYFWEAASTKFWYAPPGNITGALTAFDVSTIAQFGGNILCLTNFSHDGGDGITNTFVIVMTTGEIIMYLGNDPGTSATWNIVGKYKLGAPINARSVAAYGGDVYLTTMDDHVALQEQLTALKVGQTPPRSKICGAVINAITMNPGGVGFNGMYYGKGRRVIFNAPSPTTPGTWEQHVYNTSNQSWQRFLGMPALHWCEFNKLLYFGNANGEVWQADVGSTDNGMAINVNCQQAWSAGEIPSGKRIAGVRPVLLLLGGQITQFSLGFDYGPLRVNVIGDNRAGPASQSIWDVAIWDVALWSSEGYVNPGVHAAAGSGTSISFALSAAATTKIVWMRTDLVMEVSKQI